MLSVYDAADVRKKVRIYLCLQIQDALVVQMIYSYAAGCVNDPVSLQKYSHMIYFLLFVFEKYEIAGTCLARCPDRLTLIALLPAVPESQ